MIVESSVLFELDLSQISSGNSWIWVNESSDANAILELSGEKAKSFILPQWHSTIPSGIN